MALEQPTAAAPKNCTAMKMARQSRPGVRSCTATMLGSGWSEASRMEGKCDVQEGEREEHEEASDVVGHLRGHGIRL
jgi:hypothetical protein